MHDKSLVWISWCMAHFQAFLCFVYFCQLTNGSYSLIHYDWIWCFQLLKYFKPCQSRLQRITQKRKEQKNPQHYGSSLESALFDDFLRTRFTLRYINVWAGLSLPRVVFFFLCLESILKLKFLDSILCLCWRSVSGWEIPV